MKKQIFAVGMGPGSEQGMTAEAEAALDAADVIVGYPVYLALLGERWKNRKMLSTPMKQEKERCVMAFEEAEKGQTVAMVCSGDAGVYGMAGLLYETGASQPAWADCEVTVVPGVTAATAGAARLGAPLGHDFCVISLSDLLTPVTLIEKRLRAAAAGDFAIAIYNPSSHKRVDYLQKACDILLETLPGERVCGYVRNIGREGEEATVLTLRELREAKVDMFTTVFVGSSSTVCIDGKMVTRRGYRP
jgi:precorrin-3B C17-methyltransferase